MGNFHYLDAEGKPQGPVSEAEIESLAARAKADGHELLVAVPGGASWAPYAPGGANAAAAAAAPTPPQGVPRRPAGATRPAAAAAAPAHSAPQAAAAPQQAAPFAAPVAPAPVFHPAPQVPFGFPFAAGAAGAPAPGVHWIAVLSYIVAGVCAVMGTAWIVIWIYGNVTGSATPAKPKTPPDSLTILASMSFASALAIFVSWIAAGVLFAWLGRASGQLSRIEASLRK